MKTKFACLKGDEDPKIEKQTKRLQPCDTKRYPIQAPVNPGLGYMRPQRTFGLHLAGGLLELKISLGSLSSSRRARQDDRPCFSERPYASTRKTDAGIGGYLRF